MTIWPRICSKMCSEIRTVLNIKLKTNKSPICPQLVRNDEQSYHVVVLTTENVKFRDLTFLTNVFQLNFSYELLIRKSCIFCEYYDSSSQSTPEISLQSVNQLRRYSKLKNVAIFLAHPVLLGATSFQNLINFH